MDESLEVNAASDLLSISARLKTAAAEDVLNSGDTAWMITATLLVLLMTLPGLALFYGGLKRTGEVFKERKANPPPREWPAFEPGNTGSFRRGLATLPHLQCPDVASAERLHVTGQVIFTSSTQVVSQAELAASQRPKPFACSHVGVKPASHGARAGANKGSRAFGVTFCAASRRS